MFLWIYVGLTLDGDPCITISLGFRAPNYQNVITAYWDEVCKAHLNNDNTFYKDTTSDMMRSPYRAGEISPVSVETLKNGIKTTLNAGLMDEKWLNKWLGKYLTAPLRYHLRRPRAFFLKETLPKESESNEDVDNEEEDEEDDGLDPFILRTRHRVATRQVFDSMEVLMAKLSNGEFSLRRCEGVRIAELNGVLYINGEVGSI